MRHGPARSRGCKRRAWLRIFRCADESIGCCAAAVLLRFVVWRFHMLALGARAGHMLAFRGRTDHMFAFGARAVVLSRFLVQCFRAELSSGSFLLRE